MDREKVILRVIISIALGALHFGAWVAMPILREEPYIFAAIGVFWMAFPHLPLATSYIDERWIADLEGR